MLIGDRNRAASVSGTASATASRCTALWHVAWPAMVCSCAYKYVEDRERCPLPTIRCRKEVGVVTVRDTTQ